MTSSTHDNVIHIYTRFKKRKRRRSLPPGMAGIALCPACECDDGLFEAIVEGDKEGNMIMRGLICMSDICLGETVLDVQNGILTEVE